MYCKYCGNEIKEGKFCSNCGKNIDEKIIYIGKSYYNSRTYFFKKSKNY